MPEETSTPAGFTADPERAGLDLDALQRLDAAIRRDITQGRHFGASVIAARGGVVGYQAAIGESGVDRATRLEDRYVLMSVTKSITAVATLKMIETGLLSLDTRVADVIPEYAARGKQRVTIRHLLTHTAGAYSGFDGAGGLANSLQAGDMEAALAALAPWPILHRPGRRVVYSPWEGYGILGEVVRRLDPQKRRYRDFLTEEIFAPLGMTSSSLGLRVDHPDRVPVRMVKASDSAAQATSLFDQMNEAGEDWEVPAGSGFSTVADVFRFADALRNGGANEHGRVLSRAMVEYAFRNHTGDLQNDFWDFNKEAADLDDFPANFTLGGGYVRGEGHFLTPLGHLASPSAFGAVGSGSTSWMVDPERDLTVVFLSSGLLEGLSHFQRLQRVNDLALAAVL
ncbi:serine hydrolase domain-containing protein [Streptomyces sp. NPDC091215]|uniref:serine hydrolase domain-containing protein n=1 Tax=Streptomyces sp. NPDC091215 TaxID=3155192 RepID=UPI00342464B3